MGEFVRVDTSALIATIEGWAQGEGPLYRQLASAISMAIERGDLPPGVRLPPERSIADALPAARGTVVAAFGVLVESGLVRRRQGSGTTVVGEQDDHRPELAAGLRAQTLTGRALVAAGDAIELGLSVLDDPSSLPADAFAVDADTVSRAARGHGYAPLGIPALRDRVAALLTERGCSTDPAEVAITLGAQHGIALAAEVLASGGGTIAIEDPTYPGAIDVYARAGLTFAPVRVDRAGTVPTSLREVLEAGVGLVHLAPQCASPTGVATVSGRRDEIADLLDRSDTWLVEDAALEFLVPGRSTPDYLATRRPGRTVLVGTTSKVFWGGLRVGWLRAPRSVVERIGRLRAAHDLGSSIAPQVTALRLLDEVDALADRRAVEADARRAHLRQALETAVPGLQIDSPDGGLSLWVPVPDADRLASAAARVGLDVLAGSVCSVTGGQSDRIRVSAWAPVEVLDQAAERFAAAWKQIA